MALPRSHYVKKNTVGVYHCFSRCVRRAFLCGSDSYSHRDFSHRKAWIENRLRFLSSIFAIDVFNYSVLENHYHTILCTRPDIANTWSNTEVARRWLTLCPNRYSSKKLNPPNIHQQISLLANSPKRISQLRDRLCSLSWFMKHINEFIARAANAEDNVKGRFWESRFKSQTLLDYSAIIACMVYVDLNPIRAGLADSPENCLFSAIRQRIYDWLNFSPNPWLYPISSISAHHGIHLTIEEYLQLVDHSGRTLRSGKTGHIPHNLKPILLRLNVQPQNWIHTVSHFGNSFGLVAGIVTHIRHFASQLGKKWFVGVSAAQSAFL